MSGSNKEPAGLKTEAGPLLQKSAFGLYALLGLAMALSAFLPFRVLRSGGVEVAFTGMQFTNNLAWIVVASGAGSFLVGMWGLLGRWAPAYSVWLPPSTGLVFAGFFLLLFFQATPSISGNNYVLVSDPTVWKAMKTSSIETALGTGLFVATGASVLMAALSYPVFRIFRNRRTAK